MQGHVAYDILVVGAGPAGSSAAAAAAAAGARTLLIDAKPRIGEQPHCGEFVPRQLFTEFDLDRNCIVQTVDTMETLVVDVAQTDDPASGSPALSIPFPFGREREEHAEDSRSAQEAITLRHEIPSPGYLIDRVRFDRDLARNAASNGATVISSARLVGHDRDTWIIKHASERVWVRARLVIAADGPLSKVAEILGLTRPDVLKGVQAEVPLTSALSKTMVFLSTPVVGGYAWLFPKGPVANVGLAVVPDEGIHAARLLDGTLKWLRTLGLIGSGRLARIGGLIPVSGIRSRLVHENVIFCGDAAGLTHPISGAGIPQAVFSGRLAGRAAVKALTSGTTAHLAEYENEIIGRYGGVTNHALAKRGHMMARWKSPDFRETCEETWIAFKGYRKRVRTRCKESPGSQRQKPT